jgi:uncharacterized membrane protein
MIEGAVVWLVIATAVGCGIVGGVFFAFSSFVMPALNRLRADQSVNAMQQINVTAVTPVFMLAFTGTAILCVVAAVVAVLNWGEAGAGLVFAGSLVYVVGTFVLTIGYHVPRNDALAKVDSGGPDAAGAWATYSAQWTAMNHLRALAAVAATICFAVALLQQ